MVAPYRLWGRLPAVTDTPRYRTRPTIATDLGINRATLANWVKKYGTKTRATSPATAKSPSASVTEASADPATTTRKRPAEGRARYPAQGR
ncbi:hypothetical protein HMPREF0290_0553 [Corynebacterium efficiens YS-314]|nr:hypothetical protein HMPREF0290_0553 [Corynebacterium efficiens YS-314]